MASVISAGTTSNTSLNLSGDTSGVLQLASNGSTTAVTIDTSQNVGIGTSSPSVKLEVSGRVLGDSLVAANAVYIWSQNRMSLGASYGIESQQNSPLFMLTQGVAQPIVFGTNSTESMRIDSSGNVGIGLTSVGANRLNVSNNSVADDSLRVANARATSGDRVALFRLQANTANTSSRFLTCSGNDVAGNGDAFIIYGNGNAVNVNNSYGAISDIKLKENIVDTSPKLADLMQVKVRNYNMIGDTTKQIGVVAQELETVFPSMIDVTPDKDAENNELGTTTKSVKYSVFVPILIKAIQELKAELDATKAEVQALKGVA
jgi:hypothetical protein